MIVVLVVMALDLVLVLVQVFALVRDEGAAGGCAGAGPAVGARVVLGRGASSYTNAARAVARPKPAPKQAPPPSPPVVSEEQKEASKQSFLTLFARKRTREE